MSGEKENYLNHGNDDLARKPAKVVFVFVYTKVLDKCCYLLDLSWLPVSDICHFQDFFL